MRVCVCACVCVFACACVCASATWNSCNWTSVTAPQSPRSPAGRSDPPHTFRWWWPGTSAWTRKTKTQHVRKMDPRTHIQSKNKCKEGRLEWCWLGCLTPKLKVLGSNPNVCRLPVGPWHFFNELGNELAPGYYWPVTKFKLLLLLHLIKYSIIGWEIRATHTPGVHCEPTGEWERGFFRKPFWRCQLRYPRDIHPGTDTPAWPGGQTGVSVPLSPETEML